MRGCSVIEEDLNTDTKVFPAYAGMFLCRTFKPERKLCFPRVCKFSPRMRGCSVLVTLSFSEDKVFPAYAGMLP